MRSLLLAALAVVALPACTDSITGTGGGGGGGGDDQGSGETCTCPDGSVQEGNDCATSCPAPTGPATIAVAVDMPTYNTQLLQTVTSTVTVTGTNNFSGAVALTAAITDSTGTAITEWPVALDNSALTLTANGTATAKATITIPSVAIPSSDTTKMTGTLTVTATPSDTSVTAQNTTASIVAANTLEIDMSATTSKCTFPAEVTNGPVSVAVGTTINWKNIGTANELVIHVDGTTDTQATNDSGIAHQGEGGSPDANDPSVTGYVNDPKFANVWPEVVTKVVSGNVTWHCHAPNDNGPGEQSFTIVMPE
ncbi:MAG TPA: hypothetical protein VGL61_21350 [Kofleriaceae bacterium]